MQRSTILTTLVTDLGKIQAGGGYDTSVLEVRRGIFEAHECLNFPSIMLTAIAATRVAQTFGSLGAREHHIILRGYVQITTPGDYTELDNLVADILQWTRSVDNTYSSKTEVGNIEIYEGGPSDPVGICQLELVIFEDL